MCSTVVFDSTLMAGAYFEVSLILKYCVNVGALRLTSLEVSANCFFFKSLLYVIAPSSGLAVN